MSAPVVNPDTVLSRDDALERRDLAREYVWSVYGSPQGYVQLAWVVHDDLDGHLIVKGWRRKGHHWTGPFWIPREWLADVPFGYKDLCAGVLFPPDPEALL